MSVSEGTGGDGRREAAEEEEEGGYRTKNKNPTRQCGEKLPNVSSEILEKQHFSRGSVACGC